MRLTLFILSSLWVNALNVCYGASADTLGVAFDGGSPYAPLTVEKPLSNKPFGQSDRKEMVDQFEGFLYMAVQKPGYARWPGKGISEDFSAFCGRFKDRVGWESARCQDSGSR